MQRFFLGRENAMDFPLKGREVILRRLLDQNLVTSDEYEQMSAQWNKDYLRSRDEKRKVGNSYYQARLHHKTNMELSSRAKYEIIRFLNPRRQRYQVSMP
jgi:hypothetical protein